MRVTERNMMDSFLSNIAASRDRISRLNTQISTQKTINTLSDDPGGAIAVLRLNDKLSQNEQYQANVAHASSMMSLTAQALDQAADVLVQVKESLARASGAAVSDLAPFADDVRQMFQELLNVANTNFNGKYIFGGIETREKPYMYDEATGTLTENANGGAGTISLAVAPEILEPTNIPGQEAFGGKAMLETVLAISRALDEDRKPSEAELAALDSAMERVSGSAVKAGTTLNWLDTFQAQLESQNTALQAIRSKLQDTDMARAIVELQHQQTILDTSLKAGAESIPRTLVDFL